MYTYTRPVQENTSVDGFYAVDEATTIKSFDHSSIYRSKYFTEAMNHFDIEDKMTRNILLSVNEEDQNVVMNSLANKLYAHIVDKVDDIDFGTIPASRGDITKIDNYDQLVDCINIITEILQEYNQPTNSINIVSEALQNMIDRTDMFTKAYKLNIEMPIIIYNTIALSIVSSVSYLISSCIEFIKIPDDKGFDIALARAGTVKSRECILFKDLEKFNKICSNGEFDKAMAFVIAQNTKNLTGAAFGVGATAAIFGILLIIIPLIRELIFFFYYSRSKVSNYFEAQAALLTMNAYNIENNLTREANNKKDIANKQKKIADKFMKIANFVKVDFKTTEAKATKETEKLDKQKYKTSEVLDSVPDSSNSVLF